MGGRGWCWRKAEEGPESHLPSWFTHARQLQLCTPTLLTTQPLPPACRFQAWPEEALISVARRFLTDVPALPEELRESIAQHMAFVHQSATTASTK